MMRLKQKILNTLKISSCIRITQEPIIRDIPRGFLAIFLSDFRFLFLHFQKKENRKLFMLKLKALKNIKFR